MFTKNLLYVFFLLLLAAAANAQTDSIQQRIFLVGDAGSLYDNKQPVIDWLKEKVNWNDTSNRVIFLGDNIYEMGLPMVGQYGYEEAKEIIDYQIGLVKGKKAKAYFIPGNHDWMNGKIGGTQRVINQTEYINGLALPNVHAWPLDACPGPVLTEVDDKVVIVFGDSQWFLYLHEKPGPGSNCAAKTTEEFTTELNEMIASHPNQLFIFAVHHPFYTYGLHGGDYTIKDHIFPFTALSPNLYIPFPIIGSAYPLSRGYFGSIQDVYHPLYQNMVEEIESTLKKHPNVVHVAGHEHGLQLNIKDSIPYIVSGSGAKLTRLKKGRFNVFSHLNYGFSLIEIKKSGKAEIKFYDVNSKDLSAPVYTHQIKTIQKVTPPETIDTLRHSLPPTIYTPINAHFKANAVKKFLQGKNYRDEWTQPITLPVLDLGKEQGGLTPMRQSGSSALRILALEDKKGKAWLLRGIERFPQNIIPYDLRTPIQTSLREDAISGSYPFASVVVGALQRHAQIPAVRRKLVYVPDDPRLSRFRKDFSNTVAVLEEREPLGVKSTISTNDLIRNLQNNNDNRVDQRRVLRARLMDNFVMDFNRPDNQWQWATYDTSRKKVYYPIPQNPSQAFFVSQGVIPWLSQRVLAIPELQGFDDKADYIVSFNRSVYNFDHYFLNALTEEMWQKEIDTFLTLIDDSAIVKSVYERPTLNQENNTEIIINKLQGRRKYFRDEMIRYYKFISKEVTLQGTKQSESFKISQQPNGMVKVMIDETDTKGKSRTMYERNFDPKVTKELRIYGLEGNDSFNINIANSPILVRIIGGPGDDYFATQTSAGKTIIYDVTFEKNTIEGSGFTQKITPDPIANSYNKQEFKYDYVLPGIEASYNIDDGAIIGAEIEVFTNKFRKYPYGTRYSVQGRYATNTGSWDFRYEGDFKKITKSFDLAIRADLKAPVNVTNFFGLGNNTVFNRDSGISYYRTRYDIGNLSVYLRKQMQSWMNLDFGPTFQYFDVESKTNQGKFVSDTSVSDNSDNLFNSQYYAGVEGRILINSRNHPVLPTRGATLNVSVRQLFGLNGDRNILTQFGFDLSIFMSLNPNTKTTLGTRFGFGHNFGDFEFPQAQYLSGITNLRGFRKDRFAGRTMAFNNTELRVRLRQYRTYLFAGSYGFLVFNDIGRVWADGESSSRWHDGFGGGLWISPVNRFVITGTVAHSSEEPLLPAIGFGYQF